MPDAFNPYQAPASRDERESAPSANDPAPLATRSDRLGAAMIDGLIAIVIIAPLQFAFHVYDGFPQIHLTIVQDVVWGLVGLFVFLAVHGYFLVKSSQTVGKKLLSVQIVNFTDGSPTPASKILLARVLPLTLLAHIPKVGIFFTMLDPLFIFARNRRCAHDYVAGTKVVKLYQPKPGISAGSG